MSKKTEWEKGFKRKFCGKYSNGWFVEKINAEPILAFISDLLAKEKRELVDQINSKYFICKQCGCVEKMNVNLEALKSEIQEKEEEVGEE